MLNTGKIYLHKILGNILCWTLGIFIYTKYWVILYVEHCGKIYLHKISRNTVCWALWEDLFTQNTEEYCMVSTVGRFIYTKYWGLLFVEHWKYLFTQNNGDYFMLSTVRRVIHTKYLGILYVEHCWKIYLHKILGITSCWTLREYLFT